MGWLLATPALLPAMSRAPPEIVPLPLAVKSPTIVK
jgi:hypothetical protein